MKVLFLASAYPRGPADVITPWLAETIRRLKEREITVEVLAPSYRGLQTHSVDGVVVHRFRYAPRAWETLTHDQTAPDRIRDYPWFLALIPAYVAAGSIAAARIARSGDFDVVHAFWPLPHGVLGLAAKAVAGVPLVLTFFGVELTWMETHLRFLRPVLRGIVRRSDAVTAISSYTAERLRNALPACRPIILPFGASVEPPKVRVRQQERSSEANPFQLLFVGRLVERKGIGVLLEALAHLGIDKEHAIELRIVGEGPERPRLEAKTVRLGIEQRVRFDGLVSTEELTRRFAACDALVLPATVDAKGDTEGLGVVLLEALSYGKPVIASAAGGIVDIVRDGETGLLVPPGNVNALANAIRRYMLDPELRSRHAASGRTHVERNFSWTAIIDRLTEVYLQVGGASAKRNV